ncbi:ATP-binding protein [Glaciecola petra]|uniref:histidine kinase n=1 Tax=Glaciecola petra TaxID=3075602 RepID=A0ABU2ZS92_9ALTE|nr:ATP-binding protein [Aestuariibacter sp. P117]MDT0595503.1 ATP-binding protein [Aestuariibacter sp. P117]
MPDKYMKISVKTIRQKITSLLEWNVDDFAMIALACISAFLVNSYPISLVSGAELIFGNMFAIAITIRYGISAGLLVSICASLAISQIWGHYLSLLPNLIEILIVYIAIVKRKHPLIPCIIYWSTLGAIIVYFSYQYFTTYFTLTKDAITLKYVINGILSSTLGYLLYLIAFKNHKYALIFSFNQVINLTIFAAVLIGVSINGYYWLSETKTTKLSHIHTQLFTQASNSANEVHHYLDKTLVQLSTVAENLSLLNAPVTQQNLNLISAKLPGILTMLVTDAQGKLINTYPASLLDSIDASAFSVADRPYFSSVKDNQTPYISDAFQGRGFGNDPIVALSAPLFARGKFIGILQASLSLGYFSTLDKKQLSDEQSLLILDGVNRVVYRSEALEFDYLENLTESNLMAFIDDTSVVSDTFFIDEKNDHYFINAQSIGDTNWRALSILPRSVYEREMIELLINALGLLILFLMLTIMLGLSVSKRVSYPFSILARNITQFSHSGAFESMHVDENTPVKEVNSLSKTINEFSAQYAVILQDLKSAIKETQETNSKLALVNLNQEKEIQAQTKDINRALKQAKQASQAKSAFLANMSHEIRTPLNSIFGTLQILQNDLSDKHQKDLLTEQALFSSRSLITIINDVLDFSKIEANELTLENIPFDLLEVIENVRSDYVSTTNEKGVDFFVETHELNSKYWVGDPVRVRQILANLISNAVKFTESGEIRISFTERKNSAEQGLSIVVKDTGIGISPSAVDSLFDRFTQADISTTRKFGGTGLGLAITKHLVNMMQGDISCKSTLNQGTEFIVNLAIESTESDQIQLLSQDCIKQDMPDLSACKIMLVEDNEINATIFKTMIAPSKATIFTAVNGKDSINLYKRLKPNLVFMDIHMPVMDGIEATQHIKKINPNAIIIALTANVMKSDIEYYLESGFDDFIAKPIEIQVLINGLNRHYQKN